MSENVTTPLTSIKGPLDLTDSYKLCECCLNILESLKTHDLVSIDVSEHSSLADFMLIGTGTSSRHVIAIAEKLIEKLKELGARNLTLAGVESGEWVIVDCGPVIVHLMQEMVRERYQLDDLYRCLAAGQFSELADAS